jgi:hypothetical protein
MTKLTPDAWAVGYWIVRKSTNGEQAIHETFLLPSTVAALKREFALSDEVTRKNITEMQNDDVLD